MHYMTIERCFMMEASDVHRREALTRQAVGRVSPLACTVGPHGSLKEASTCRIVRSDRSSGTLGESAGAPSDPPTTESLAQSGYSRRRPPFAHHRRDAPGRELFTAPGVDRAAWDGTGHYPRVPTCPCHRLCR